MRARLGVDSVELLRRPCTRLEREGYVSSLLTTESRATGWGLRGSRYQVRIYALTDRGRAVLDGRDDDGDGAQQNRCGDPLGAVASSHGG